MTPGRAHEEVEALAQELVSGVAANEELQEASRDAAAAILYLAAVRRYRYEVLESVRQDPAVRLRTRADRRYFAAALSLGLRGYPIPEWLQDMLEGRPFNFKSVGPDFTFKMYAVTGRELKTIAEYERKAYSARRRAIQRLDLLLEQALVGSTQSVSC